VLRRRRDVVHHQAEALRLEAGGTASASIATAARCRRYELGAVFSPLTLRGEAKTDGMQTNSRVNELK